MSLSSSQRAALTGVVERDRIRWDEPLASRTTYRIGGPADALVTLLDVEELTRVLALCRNESIRWKIFGHGSNILADDGGFRGLVIVLAGEFKYIVRQQFDRPEVPIVKAGSAVGLPRLAVWCCREGYGGLAFAAGIPGTVGGAVIMNAGAWGEEIAGIVETVDLGGADGVVSLPADDMHFSYRSCRTMRERFSDRVITSVRLRLNSEDPELIRSRMQTLLDQRRSTQPLNMPSGGSVFKNPPGASAGRLIEQAGLKGFCIGDAQVSEKHANFFVNRGRARAAEMLSLLNTVRDRVQSATGVILEPEIEYLPAEVSP